MIGDGGSCAVYRVELFGVTCAVKVLSPQYADVNHGQPEGDEGQMSAKQAKRAEHVEAWNEKQFMSEMSVLARVQHPHLLRLLAVSTNGPKPCLVLELMDEALDERLGEARKETVD
jgi:serine/threonine protein kinase